MPVLRILSFLIPPGKNILDPDPIRGREITKESEKLYALMRDIFSKSDNECDIPIGLRNFPDESQKSEVLELLIKFLSNPVLDVGFEIAARLQSVSTRVSKLGLLFIILGKEGKEQKLVISRFPVSQGIVADIDNEELIVQLVEQMFIKDSKKYKAALFKGTNPQDHFWKGYVVDRQLNDYAQYWISKFLDSELLVTSKAGSMRIAKVLKKASQSAKKLRVKEDIAAISLLLRNNDKKEISLAQICKRVSDETASEIISNVRFPELIEEVFIFDAEEFYKHAPYKSIELDNDAVLIAPLEKFEDCFTISIVDKVKSIYQFLTEGRIVENRIRGIK